MQGFKSCLEAYGMDNSITMERFKGKLGLAPLYDAICAIVEPLRTQEERDNIRSYTGRCKPNTKKRLYSVIC